MSDKIKIRTLVSYLPVSSVGLSTSLLGRILFIACSTTSSLWYLRVAPQDYIPHLLLFFASILGIYVVGSPEFLISRRSIMLILTCIIIGALNTIFTAPNHYLTKASSLNYGLSRGFSFAGLSFATLLVVIITRPSDLGRFLIRFKCSWWFIALGTIPFSTLDTLSDQYNDILLVTRARHRNQHFPIVPIVVEAVAALLATVLQLSLHLFQLNAHKIKDRVQKVAPNATLYAPIFGFADLMLLALTIPMWVSILIELN